ncbi:sensor histidine kinase [Conexibacter woesei]|uniref:sensor histidine kinase n=1 Tax=Conexibacter woesei TaxID=191495 RepID=UPI00040D099F|nr:sensor histidine kinase [Conexibacter woesei]
MSRLRSGQWLALTAGGLLIAALIGVVVCLIALHRLTLAREQVVDRVDPARVASQLYLTALVDQESGIRGYQVGGTPDYLQPYDAGGRDAVRARTRLEQLAATGRVPHLREDLGAVALASTSWHLLYADPSILTIRAEGKDAPDIPPIATGKQLFDNLRAAFTTLQNDLIAERASARTRLRHAAALAEGAVLFTAALIILASIAAGLVLRRVVALPLSHLARDARRVARGEFGHVVEVEGPKDIQGLSTDVESMRQRIVAELETVNRSRALLEEQTQDLQRSNAELEQFAYVASHDLQEPLRKVASFTGMLQHRYQGQLDDRADQYIEFAVDGAKRMQVLINDLLAFSRVGRVGTTEAIVSMDDATRDAQRNLAAALEESGATVTVDGPLPDVRGDRSLLTALLQNLIGNAIKFHGDEQPRVDIDVSREGDMYTFTVRDNGIGIAPRYADRIFVIFQRLHPKEEYTGTGIGLAMCRKIVEFHGGEIWLDNGPEGSGDGVDDGATQPEASGHGATFRFTLPVPTDDDETSAAA